MSGNNRELWDQVFKTDPAKVKPITGKQYRGSSPNPYWLIQRATETFGPCGVGWGFSVKERIEDAGPAGKMHIAKVRVWYKFASADGIIKVGEVEHVGGTPFSGQRKSGDWFMDEDAPKKSVTDALVKALSLLGFAGDIFSGRWDDSKYVQEVGEEFKDSARKKAEADAREKWIGKLDEAAAKGLLEFRNAWKSMSPADRGLVKDHLETWKEVANAASPSTPA